MMESFKILSKNDSAVLGALFDPEASLQNHARIDLLMDGPYDRATLNQIKEKERQALLPINIEQPSTVEIQRAISGLSSIITQYPKYPSAWNNRAQARRMQHEAYQLDQRDRNINEVFTDLAKAIELSSQTNAMGMTSPENAKVLASAHTHRGYVLWNASHSDTAANELNGVESLKGLNRERLEEMASRDFALGGRYGNPVARQLSVKTNPYAKLCGSIVREAMEKEVREFNASSL